LYTQQLVYVIQVMLNACQWDQDTKQTIFLLADLRQKENVCRFFSMKTLKKRDKAVNIAVDWKILLCVKSNLRLPAG
jgi:hypothetical protein